MQKWFYPWIRWRLGRGEFKKYGPANPSYRPHNVPKKIPRWAWERAKLYIPAPTQYEGILSKNGAWLRSPKSGVEDVSEMKSAGCNWLTLNVGDYSEYQWELIRTRARLFSVYSYPWRRVRNSRDLFDLINVAKFWDTQVIGLNLESEAKDVLPPSLCRSIIDANEWDGEVVVITEPWLYNAVDWKPLSQYPVVLEIFPQESNAAKFPAHCVAHAKELGFKYVFQAFGAYGGAKPSWYNLSTPYSIYTGDDIGVGNWNKWF